MLEYIKTLLTSKRAMAVVMAIIAQVLGRYGFEVTDADQQAIITHITDAISALLATYAVGRHVSQKKKAK